MIWTYLAWIGAACSLGSMLIMHYWHIPHMKELYDQTRALSDAAVKSYDTNSEVVKTNNRLQRRNGRRLRKSVDAANAEWQRMRQMLEDNNEGEGWKQ